VDVETLAEFNSKQHNKKSVTENCSTFANLTVVFSIIREREFVLKDTRNVCFFSCGGKERDTRRIHTIDRSYWYWCLRFTNGLTKENEKRGFSELVGKKIMENII